MLLAILCFIAGAALVATGIYFLTPGFQNKTNFRHTKAISYVALGLGALTIVWGFMFLSFPQAQAAFALVYMFLLLGAVTFLMLLMK